MSPTHAKKNFLRGPAVGAAGQKHCGRGVNIGRLIRCSHTNVPFHTSCLYFPLESVSSVANHDSASSARNQAHTHTQTRAHTHTLTSSVAQTWRKREIEPKSVRESVAGSELELRYQQLEKRVKVMEASLADERKLNKELETDLQTAGMNHPVSVVVPTLLLAGSY